MLGREARALALDALDGRCIPALLGVEALQVEEVDLLAHRAEAIGRRRVIVRRFDGRRDHARVVRRVARVAGMRHVRERRRHRCGRAVLLALSRVGPTRAHETRGEHEQEGRAGDREPKRDASLLQHMPPLTPITWPVT